jgi:hypothetical protein
MADYVAVAEAVRLAEKKTTLLREVMKARTQTATRVAGRASSTPEKQHENSPPKK